MPDDQRSEHSCRSAGRELIAIAVPVGYLAALTVQVLLRGVPLDREQVLLWVVVGVVAISSATTESGRVVAALRDWLPLAVLLLFYDWSRGIADGLGMPVQEEFPAAFDRWLLPGGLPTAVLQRELLHPFEVRWWETVVAVVYVSHFVVPYLMLGWAWIRDRLLWTALTARFLMLTAMGLLTYVLAPTAPPWLLARQGRLEPVTRSAGRGWRNLHLDIATDLIDKGQSTVNLVAALPSLHAAYPMMFLVALWPRLGVGAKLAMATYTAAMAFTLVLSAEHFVFDILVGWLYAGLACWLVTRLEQARSRRVVA